MLKWQSDGHGGAESNLKVQMNTGEEPKYRIVKTRSLIYGIRYMCHENLGFCQTIRWVPNLEAEGFDRNTSTFNKLSQAKKAIEFHENFRVK